jgi:thiamine biosynthesis lipoprotein
VGASQGRLGRIGMILAPIILIALIIAIRVGGVGPSASPAVVTYPTRTMGTYAGVMLVTADSAATAGQAQAVHSVFAYIDSLMSNWTKTSEVARINREAGSTSLTIHPEVAVVLDESMRVWRESDGAFDVTIEPLVRAWGFLGGKPHVPSDEEAAAAFARVGAGQIEFDAADRTLSFSKDGVQIDFGGVAKGYAVDMAAQELETHGVRDALVDLSGNMYALGSPPDADAWRIGIRDPRDRMPFFARLLITGEAVATSGKYEQFVAVDGKEYGHILDPRSGKPAEGLISVTVVAPLAMSADAWGTALFVLGPEAARVKASERDDIAVVLVEPGAGGKDIVWIEEPLRDVFKIETKAKRLFEVRYF